MDVAVSTTERIVGWRQLLLSAILCLLTSFAFALPETPVDMADPRAKAVTQVVLGILGYARWP